MGGGLFRHDKSNKKKASTASDQRAFRCNKPRASYERAKFATLAEPRDVLTWRPYYYNHKWNRPYTLHLSSTKFHENPFTTSPAI